MKIAFNDEAVGQAFGYATWSPDHTKPGRLRIDFAVRIEDIEEFGARIVPYALGQHLNKAWLDRIGSLKLHAKFNPRQDVYEYTLFLELE